MGRWRVEAREVREVGKPGFHTEWPALWSLMGRGHFLRTADQTTYHHSEQFHLCSHIGSMGAPCTVYVYSFNMLFYMYEI